MKGNLLIMALASVSLLAAAGPADAHHSWQLDRSKMLTLTGTVTRFDFANPHVQVYFDVKDENGDNANWQAGGPSPISSPGAVGLEKASSRAIKSPSPDIAIATVPESCASIPSPSREDKSSTDIRVGGAGDFAPAPA